MQLMQFPDRDEFENKYLSSFPNHLKYLAKGTIGSLIGLANYQTFNYDEAINIAWNTFYLTEILRCEDTSWKNYVSEYMKFNRNLHIRHIKMALQNLSYNI